MKQAAYCVLLAMLGVAIGCVTPARGASPPKAKGREGAVVVEWTGILMKLYTGAPATARPPINVVGGGGWTAVVRVWQAKPDVRPLVDRGWAVWSFQDPIEFFGTNKIRVGTRVKGRTRVWRDEKGYVWGEPVATK